MQTKSTVLSKPWFFNALEIYTFEVLRTTFLISKAHRLEISAFPIQFSRATTANRTRESFLALALSSTQATWALVQFSNAFLVKLGCFWRTWVWARVIEAVYSYGWHKRQHRQHDHGQQKQAANHFKGSIAGQGWDKDVEAERIWSRKSVLFGGCTVLVWRYRWAYSRGCVVLLPGSEKEFVFVCSFCDDMMGL